MSIWFVDLHDSDRDGEQTVFLRTKEDVDALAAAARASGHITVIHYGLVEQCVSDDLEELFHDLRIKAC